MPLPSIPPSAPNPLAAAFSDSTGTAFTTPGKGLAPVNANGMYVVGGWAFAAYNDGGATNISGTGKRICQPFKRTASKVAMYFPAGPGQTYANAGEAPLGTPLICAADIAWPATNTPLQFTVGGRKLWAVVPDGANVQTDSIDLYIPAGSAPAVRCYMRSLRPPASPAAAAAAGGSIAAGTYYIKLTSFCADAESVASSEITATTALTNLAISLTWQSHRDDQFVGIYIGTATGANHRIAIVPAAAGAFTLTSLSAFPAAGVSELPFTYTAQGVPLAYMSITQSGEFFNRISNGSDGSNLTGTTATAGGAPLTGPSTSGAPTALLLADYQPGATDACVYVLGDSITVGVGTIGGGGIYAQGLGGYPSRALWTRNLESWMTHGIGGTQLQTILSGGSYASARIEKLKYAKIVYSEFGTNDIAVGGLTWQQHAANQIIFSNLLPTGLKLRLCTLTPRTVNTDFGMTNANMTPDAYNTARINYNTWIRNGAQVDGSGNPILTGGTPYYRIDGANYFDACSAVEVNSSNVLTQNGGYWLAPTAAVTTGWTLSANATGFASGAVGTLQVSGTPFTAGSTTTPGQAARVVQMTSGAQSGKLAVVASHTTSILTTYANGLASYTGNAATASAPITASPSLPAIGDQFSIWECTSIEGVHPTEYGHSLLATAFSAHLTAVGA